MFVACLPCSGLIYAEGSWTQGTEDWLSTHVRLFQFIGGVPARVVPDNLKTGVTHASYWDPVINASYAALIRHYGTVVLPARKGKPKDKPSAESGVIQVYRWLLAPLRNQKFFSLPEFRGGRVGLDRVPRFISGSPAVCCRRDAPLWRLMQGGRSPTGMRRHNGGEIHAATAWGRLSK
ncbi:MAG: DDE-type integrase/transposase/recombinase [Alphaproteobacteria bacterium]|nr:DDE-type integrase/transposase/recombinase [Alphaproteobacteria bacterium]